MFRYVEVFIETTFINLIAFHDSFAFLNKQIPRQTRQNPQRKMKTPIQILIISIRFLFYCKNSDVSQKKELQLIILGLTLGTTNDFIILF